MVEKNHIVQCSEDHGQMLEISITEFSPSREFLIE